MVQFLTGVNVYSSPVSRLAYPVVHDLQPDLAVLLAHQHRDFIIQRDKKYSTLHTFIFHVTYGTKMIHPTDIRIALVVIHHTVMESSAFLVLPQVQITYYSQTQDCHCELYAK
jgi:hypothetical protein